VTSRFRVLAASILASVFATAPAWAQNFVDPRTKFSDPGCTELKLVSTGAPFPRDPTTLAVRWTGFANWELAYKNEILLLDVYIDRGATFMPLGFKAADITRANAILIGHGHSDHMSDAASIANRLKIPVVGAPVTAEKLAQQSVPAGQIKPVTGKDPKTETMQVGLFKIEPVLGRHGEPPQNITAAFNAALQATTPAYSTEEQAELTQVNQRGTSDPRVTPEGTIAYVITLDNGFTIMYRDSGGVVTEQETAAMERQKNVDLALVAVSSAFLNTETVQRALEHVAAYKPAIYWPGHNDAGRRGLWRATDPLFQAVRDKYPDIATVARTYREPVCFDTRIQQKR
jgi:L-ascorbate metabolism protein UlaG (beta-lactamase superfamily)